MEVTLEKLHALARLLDENQPPPAELYVPAAREIASDIIEEIEAGAPGEVQKHLIFGARGAGKSTQMREVARGLAKTRTVVEIDLDAGRIGTPELSAFDLVYVIGLAVLKTVPDKQQEELGKRLLEAYGGKEKDKLGKLKETLAGITGFGTASTAAAAAFGLATGPVAAVAAATGVAAAGITLLARPESVVSARSVDGRKLNDAVTAILAAAQAGRPPLVVLVDGLEKINGHAAQWMRDTFENTVLVLELPVTIVIATPPCTFYEANAVDSLGYVPHSVWGFAPDEGIRLVAILRRRIEAVGLDADEPGFAAACRRCAEASGGHPRWAVRLLKRALSRAIRAERTTIADDDVADAVRELREFLANPPELELLAVVDETGKLPRDAVAARLFQTGRVLVHPPDAEGVQSFHVHPLLRPALDKYRREHAAVKEPA